METVRNTDIDVMRPESLSLENRAAAFSVVILTYDEEKNLGACPCVDSGWIGRKGYLGAKDLKVS